MSLDEGDEVAQWFTAYLGSPVRLVRYLGRQVSQQAVTHPRGIIIACHQYNAVHERQSNC